MKLSSGFDERTDGKGVEVFDEVDRVVRLVKAYQLASPEIATEIRRCLFARFPYSLVYGIDGETIVVIAVVHSHRKPRYWIDRVS